MTETMEKAAEYWQYRVAFEGGASKWTGKYVDKNAAERSGHWDLEDLQENYGVVGKVQVRQVKELVTSVREYTQVD